MPDQHPTTPAARSDARPSDPDATAPGTTRPTNSEFGLGAPAVPGELGALGPYRVLKELGRGGMGAVYRAIDTRLDRTVALKVLLPALAADPAARERFLREAKAAAKLSHDNVVTVYEADERDGVPYIAMQLLQGYPLDQYLKTKGAPPLAHVVRIGIEAARGLAAAHALGLVHRDIKPANLWLESPNGRVKVLDFGLAKPVGTDAELTKSGAVVGTPAFMSPEQARGLKVDHRTDIFSLGAVLYRVLAGRNPFAGANMMAVLMALGTEDPMPLRELNAEVPAALAELIHRMLAKKPEDRPQSAREVAYALRAVLAQPSTEVSTSHPVVVQAVPVAAPMEVSAVAASAFANLMDDDADAPTEHESEPVRESAGAGGSRKGLLLAGGVLALIAVVAVAVALGTGGKKPDDTAKGGDPVAVPPKPNEKNPPKKGGELPAVPAWKPIPVGESPFDKLDPNEIPKEERFDWQPKELVGVIGSHRRGNWYGNEYDAVAFSPNRSLAATGSTDIIIWDMKTQTPKMVIPSRGIGWGDDMFPGTRSVQFLPDGKRLFCLRFANGVNIQLWDVSGAGPKLLPFGTGEKAEVFWCPGVWWATLVEQGETAVAYLTEGSPAVAKLRTFNLRGLKPEPGGKDVEIRPSDEYGQHHAIASSGNRAVYVTKDHKVRQVTIQKGQFDADTELPVPLGREGSVRAITPDGSKLVVWAEKQFQVWDLSATPPRIVNRISEQPATGANSLVVISPDGKWVTMKYNHTALFRLDAEAPKLLAWLDQTDAAGGFGSIAFSADSAKVILGNHNGLVRFWDLSGSEPKELLPFEPATAFPIPDWIRSTMLDGRQGRILLPRYDVQPGKWNRYQYWDLAGTKPAPLAVIDPSNHGPMFALGQDRFVQLAPMYNQIAQRHQFKNQSFEPLGEPFGSPNAFGNVSPDGRTMIVYAPADEPKQLEGWDVSSDTPKQLWTQPPKDQTLLGGSAGCKVWFSADNRWFATQAKGEKDGQFWKLVLWRNTGAKPEVHATLPIEWQVLLYRAAFSADGRYLAHTPARPEEIVLLDLSGKEPREVARYRDNTKVAGDHANLVFHPDGKTLAVGGGRGVCVLDVTTMKPLWDWQSPGPIWWLDWAADGRHLVTHNTNSTVYVLRVDPTFPAERKAAEYVLSIGGSVQVDVDGMLQAPIKAVKDLPKEAFQLKVLDLTGNTQVSDAELAKIKDCKNLTHLLLHGCSKMTDAGLVSFKDCRNLTHLQLNNTQVSDAGLATFKNCIGLGGLELHHTQIGDSGLQYFRDCNNLTQLHLAVTKVTDAGLIHLKDCKELTNVSLAFTKVTDIGLANFKDCKRLAQLDLNGAEGVTDVGLAHLRDCKQLSSLVLQP